MEASNSEQYRVCTSCGRSVPPNNFLLHRIHCNGGNGQNNTQSTPESEFGDENQDGWNCARCTFLNVSDLRFCEMCGTRKTPAENLGPPESATVHQIRFSPMGRSRRQHPPPVGASSDGGGMMDNALFGAGMGALMGGGLSLMSGRSGRQTGSDMLTGAALGGVTGSLLPMMQQIRESRRRPHPDDDQGDPQRQIIMQMLRQHPELMLLLAQRGLPDVDEMDYDQLLQAFGGPRQRPANSEVVSALPTERVTTKMAGGNGQGGGQEGEGGNDQCSVCLESYSVGQEVKSLPCMHRFHSECIDHWLQTSGTCPICKFDLTGG